MIHLHQFFQTCQQGHLCLTFALCLTLFCIENTAAQQTCKVEGVIQVTINPKPSATFDFVVNGLNITFQNNSAHADTWLWEFGNGQTSTAQNPSHTFTSPGTYTVTLTGSNTNGCSSTIYSQTVDLSCPPIAVSVAAAGSTSICPGESVVLNASGGFQNYQWWKDGQPIVGATGVSFSAISSGDFTVVASDAAGCTGSSNALSVSEKPLAVPNFSASVLDLSATFTNSSSFATTYLWDFGDPNSGAANTSMEANPSHQFSAAGSYTVVLTATNDCGSVSYSQTVDLNCPPIAVSVAAAGSTSICLGESVELQVSGGSFSTYQWYQNDMVISGATTASYEADEYGLYKVFVTDMFGCGNFSNEMTIEVNPQPNAVIETLLAGGVCEGAATWLSATGGISYEWSTPAGQSVISQDIQIPMAIQTHTGTYHVTVTDDLGCTATTSYSLVVNPKPEPIIIGLPVSSTYSVSDAPDTLIAIPAGATFEGPGIVGAVFSPTMAGVGLHQISVWFTDSLGCSGHTQYSVEVLPTVSSKAPEGFQTLTVFPVPSSGDFFLKIVVSEAKSLKINVLNPFGQTIESRSSNLPSGESILKFEKTELPPGSYFVEIWDNGRRNVLPILISK